MNIFATVMFFSKNNKTKEKKLVSMDLKMFFAFAFTLLL